MVYQVTAGLLEGEEKRQQFASLSADELSNALKAAPIPVVLGFETHSSLTTIALAERFQTAKHITQR
jgi:hypothetical protein